MQRRRRRYAAVAAATAFALAGTAVAGQVLGRSGDGDRAAPIGETVTGMPAPAPAPFSACTVSVLPAPPGKGVLSGEVVADPTGRYAAASLVQPDGTIRPVLWTDGEPTVLPGAGGNAQPRAVNSAGVVVGTSSSDGGAPMAWIYRDRHVVKLAPVTGYDWWVPLSVDERGDVTGEAWRGMRFAVVSWAYAEPLEKPVLVTKPADVRGSGVGGDGTVVGTRGTGFAPYAWHVNGSGRTLELPPGAATGQALAVRGGWAAGWVGLSAEVVASKRPVAPRVQGTEPDRKVLDMPGTATGGKVITVPARWDLRTGKVTHWPARTTPATAVNASGWVAVPGDGGPAVVSPDGRTTALPGPADGYPTALSDDNRRLYGERVPLGTGVDARAKERISKGAAAELLMWRC
ncbi:hypothetical protein ACFQ1L_21575 [Phytohabitans flavus]|uniref:Uncharacterized protein n=1 Tax=Phytohabitans flavus TaxID=1076124 RepID=A0A6F8XTX8_9ACTN|nr:hypothetical protein [Phytohabitans flavus]BCB77247.1 hypothetical protein Pflav_036570 [Phytohabitans flavus]